MTTSVSPSFVLCFGLALVLCLGITDPSEDYALESLREDNTVVNTSITTWTSSPGVVSLRSVWKAQTLLTSHPAISVSTPTVMTSSLTTEEDPGVGHVSFLTLSTVIVAVILIFFFGLFLLLVGFPRTRAFSRLKLRCRGRHDNSLYDSNSSSNNSSNNSSKNSNSSNTTMTSISIGPDDVSGLSFTQSRELTPGAESNSLYSVDFWWPVKAGGGVNDYKDGQKEEEDDASVESVDEVTWAEARGGLHKRRSSKQSTRETGREAGGEKGREFLAGHRQGQQTGGEYWALRDLQPQQQQHQQQQQQQQQQKDEDRQQQQFSFHSQPQHNMYHDNQHQHQHQHQRFSQPRHHNQQQQPSMAPWNYRQQQREPHYQFGHPIQDQGLYHNRPHYREQQQQQHEQAHDYYFPGPEDPLLFPHSPALVTPKHRASYPYTAAETAARRPQYAVPPTPPAAHTHYQPLPCDDIDTEHPHNAQREYEHSRLQHVRGSEQRVCPAGEDVRFFLTTQTPPSSATHCVTRMPEHETCGKMDVSECRTVRRGNDANLSASKMNGPAQLHPAHSRDLDVSTIVPDTESEGRLPVDKLPVTPQDRLRHWLRQADEPPTPYNPTGFSTSLQRPQQVQTQANESLHISEVHQTTPASNDKALTTKCSTNRNRKSPRQVHIKRLHE